MHPAQPAIEGAALALGYGRLVVLEVDHLSIGAGDYIGIVGPNGAGKTTLLKAITGIIRPLSGSIRVAHGTDGAPLRFGYVAQSTTLDATYPVSTMDVVLMGRIGSVGPFRRFRPEDIRAAFEALERVDLPDLAEKPFGELSRGQQQRILLARALAGGPDILCLDEPTNFLDPASQMGFMETLQQMRQTEGMTILVVTHLLQAVAQHSDQAWLVQGGALRKLSDPVEIEAELVGLAEGARRGQVLTV